MYSVGKQVASQTYRLAAKAVQGRLLWLAGLTVLYISAPSAQSAPVDLAKAQQERQSLKAELFSRPGDPGLLLQYARACQKVGDLDDAIAKAREATMVAPNMIEAHIQLGRYLESDRDYRAALLQFERALELRPKPSQAVSVYTPMLRVLNAMNEMKRADLLSLKWVKENQESADCHYNRAWILSCSCQPGEVPGPAIVTEYKRALELDPSLSDARYNLALVLHQQGQDSQAKSQLQEFLKAAPEDVDAGKARALLLKLSQ